MEYLIKDYDEKGKVTLIDEDELWRIFQAAKENPRHISVYKVGNCILDWS